MSKFDEMSDGDLATLAIGGKQAAYRVLLDRHRNAVFASPATIAARMMARSM
jgi:hypothetical protein